MEIWAKYNRHSGRGLVLALHRDLGKMEVKTAVIMVKFGLHPALTDGTYEYPVCGSSDECLPRIRFELRRS